MLASRRPSYGRSMQPDSDPYREIRRRVARGGEIDPAAALQPAGATFLRRAHEDLVERCSDEGRPRMNC